MLDIKFIREHKDLVQMAANKRRSQFKVAELIVADNRRKELLSSIEEKRSKQNHFNDKIANSVGDEQQKLITEMKELKDVLQKEEEELKQIIISWQKLMLEVPNIPDMSVPDGESDKDNVEIRKWGEVKTFDFKPKNHIKLLEDLDMVDFKRGIKTAGFRGYYLKKDGALLYFALAQFAMGFAIKKGFTPFIAPSLVKGHNFLATGHFPKSKDEIYKVEDDLYLSGTAEVPMMGFHFDEKLNENDLPKKYIAFSPCYRKEAGSHGKDTKGLLRVHEFFKLEQFIICRADHEESVRFHEWITKNAEEMMQALNLPYRVVANCTGDISQGAVKTYDIEAWMPGEGNYRETHSSTYFHDFQSRRAGIKYRSKEDDKVRHVYTLNNTALAGPRIIIPIVENNQQEDGSVVIPEALRPYMGGKEIIKISS